MDKQVNKKLRKLWIHVLVIIFAIPCFFMGRAFAYWAGLVNPPADQNRTAQNPVGSGKELAVTFNFDNIYTSTDTEKLVPTGCSAYAYPGTTVSEIAIKDFKMSWSTTDITALESKVLIQFINIGLCDTFNSSFYTNYSSYCKVKVSFGEYTTPGDHTSFSGTDLPDIYTGNSLGTPMEFMLDRGEEKILRLQVSIDDYSRSSANHYRTFKNAVVNSNFRINFQCTVENPNLHKTTNIWATFDTASVTNQDKGPYDNETNIYIYHPDIKIYVANQKYKKGDILYVNDPTSPHYGKYYMVLRNDYININNPNPYAGAPMTWAEATTEYREYHHYYQGDFVVEPDGIYFWNSPYNPWPWRPSHNPNTSNALPPSNNNSYWQKYPTTFLDVWHRHKAYTYGDVVRWWSTSTVGTGQTLNRQYVSIADINIISSDGAGSGMGDFPGTSSYSSQWVTVAQFQTRSAAFDSDKAYTEGESMLYTDGKYYIAIRNTVAGRTPVNSPNHWREVSW